MNQSKKDIINFSLSKALMENGFILLPGTGMFFLIRYPARVDNAVGKIIPPGFKIEFLESTGISDYFLAYYIAEQFNSDLALWNRELIYFSAEINALEEGIKFDLGHIGSLYKSGASALKFHQSDLSNFVGLNSLPTLDCIPIPIFYKKDAELNSSTDSAVASEIKDLPEIKDTKTKNNAHWWWLLIIIAALFLSSILYDKCNKSDHTEFAPPPHISQDRFNQPPVKLYVDSFQQEDSNRSEQDGFTFEKYNDEGDQIQDNEVWDESEESENEDQLPWSDEIEDSSEQDQMEATTNHFQVGGRCIIITGSFSRTSNVQAQSNHLRSLGYEIYTENIGNLTRVGVLVNCDKADLQSELNYIRFNIESSSWIMEDN